jgi:hypothetical protein
MINKVILLSGKSATGKSASLQNLKNPEGVLYLNCEAGKPLPFNHKFNERVITDPLHVPGYIESWDKKEDIHTIIIDSLSFMMEQYESQYVIPATNGMKAWGNYAQFFKTLMQDQVAKSTKNIVFITHTMDVVNEAEMINETMATVKGSLKNLGIESYFTTVISSKKVQLTKLTAYQNPLLVITEDDEILGFKYVFQTKLTKDTVNERMRSHLGLWRKEETYINNDAQIVLDRLNEYYN